MTIMPFEGLMDESVEDVTGTDHLLEPLATDSDVDWYVAEVIAPVWDVEDASTGWLHATVEDFDKIIFPAFDLLGEPWTGH